MVIFLIKHVTGDVGGGLYILFLTLLYVESLKECYDSLLHC